MRSLWTFLSSSITLFLVDFAAFPFTLSSHLLLFVRSVLSPRLASPPALPTSHINSSHLLSCSKMIYAVALPTHHRREDFRPLIEMPSPPDLLPICDTASSPPPCHLLPPFHLSTLPPTNYRHNHSTNEPPRSPTVAFEVNGHLVAFPRS